MGIQVESSLEPPRSSFAQQYGPWHYHDVRSSRYGWGEGAALISNAFSERFAGAEGSKSKTARPAIVIEREQEEYPTSVSTSLSRPLPPLLVQASSPPTPSPWVFTQIHPTDPILTFPLNVALVASLPTPRPSLKRSRPSTDVDGHNTAPLPCKKRRLRLHFVTSRLSRPFSLPATHILNRESILKGDKRLRSIAAAANKRMAMAGWGMGAAGQNRNGGGGGGGMTTMGGNGSAAWLRKMAVMNRFRMRMLGENLARAQQAAQAAQAQAAGQGGQGSVPGGQAGGHAGANGGGGGNTGGVPMQRTAQQHQGYAGSGTSPRLPPGQQLQAGGQQPPVITGFPPPVIHTNNTTASSGPSAPSAAPQRLSPSPPRLRPLRSPDLRPIEDQDLDDDEDVAFPTSAHESRYEGEEEEEGHEVYADFGVLFGGGGGDDVDEEEGNSMSGEMPVEQQQESLDGIPWGASRC
ncbi:hypothetical protein B0H65DRAFT_512883 [Neurospora tetraspora]|uniref:Uncharacterized protein n=1 Tax=Neurospora tetraspora TaxID=94610 RepID=A0AAE0J0K2_9PEZI|nr:hypothetical protein B0H65DRAFT_512883 [Neurospora tetraspora]